ncbi:MAG: class IV adenylate cyclase [bacterium]
MPRNIEIKVRLGDLAAARDVVRGLGAQPHVIEVQTDRYYELDGGRRVKLRSIVGGRAEMIDYARPEASGVRASDYTITPVRDASGCQVPRGEPLVIVRKRREVLLIDNVRVHLDDVDGLGTFLELEAVVDAAHDDAVCRAQVARIMAGLGVREADLIRASYAELLQGARAASTRTTAL